ncbi:MAG TPA: hypothetical protein VNW98_00840 [Burkholderiaceae bacterium]|jgi:hypothetical protein|nr:hypothetical protein [Burkholderiaceae bacterium]
MNFNRRSYREDLLFVIALLVPAVFAGARYFESEAQMTQIAQAQQKAAEVVNAARAPTNLDVVQSTLAAR